MFIKKQNINVSTFTVDSIAYAIKSAWRDLMNFEHPVFGRLKGPENCRIDVMPQHFLSAASGCRVKNGRMEYIINAWMVPEEQLPQLVKWLKEVCTPRQIKQIRALIRRINNENQLNRTRKRDRRIWAHDTIFVKWNQEDDWAICMKAFCEQFDIPLPLEFQKEWEGGW